MVSRLAQEISNPLSDEKNIKPGENQTRPETHLA